MTFRKYNKSSYVPQQMLKILPSYPNAVAILVVYCLEFLPGNWGYLAEGVFRSWISCIYFIF